MNRYYGLYFCLLWLFSSLCYAEVVRLELTGPEHKVPIKVYLPEDLSSPAPVVIFSHGLGGSREGSAYLGEQWSAAGYVVVAVQHPGSDATAWNEVPKWKRLKALKKAASLESFMKRVSDVKAVLDFIEDSQS